MSHSRRIAISSDRISELLCEFEQSKRAILDTYKTGRSPLNSVTCLDTRTPFLCVSFFSFLDFVNYRNEKLVLQFNNAYSTTTPHNSRLVFSLCTRAAND